MIGRRFDLLVSIKVASVLVEHVCQNILSVLQTLYHLEVSALHRRVERVGAPFATFVDVGHDLRLRAKHDFCVVLEVYLNNFVGEAEHDSVPCAHPLLNVNDVLDATLPPLHIIRNLRVRVGLLRAF